MKKRLATFAATGALAVGALAGTAASASATTVHPDLGYACSQSLHECFYYQGAFVDAASCVDFVSSLSNPAGWDCEYYSWPWFSGTGTVGWYATSVYFPKTS